MNPALAPRQVRCSICRGVAAVEDVNVRLFDEDGKRQRPAAALDYLRSIGFPAREKNLRRGVAVHARHVKAWLDSGALVAPMHQPPASEITRIEPVASAERARWMDVNQSTMDVGMDALRSLRARLEAGDLEPKEELALAKLGLTASSKRADMAAKGAERDPIDALMQLAAGVARLADGQD